MDPITQKIISLTKGAAIPEVSDVFQTYAWGKPDVASNGAAGIHTSLSTVDLTEGGMVMGKRWDTTSDWYIADTVNSPLDGSDVPEGYGEVSWTQSPPLTTGGFQSGTQQNWTVPVGVTSVCMLVIGGGAGADGGGNGGGGGLTWINDVPVTPGTTLKIYHGRTGGRNGSYNGQDGRGEYSYILDANGVQIIEAGGGWMNGANGQSGGNGGNQDFRDPIYASLPYGGGKGGMGNGPGATSGKGGGGGAAGYSGNGGDGGTPCSYGSPGQGGGGGGGGGNCSQDGGQGGGVGIYGEGASGAGGADGNYASPGQGGSGGYAGAGSYGQWTKFTGMFGGGSGAGSGGAARGAVRILWGAGRAFPSTNVGQSQTHADYGSCNNSDKLHTSMLQGITQWTNRGFVWDQSDTDTQMNGNADAGNHSYIFRKCKKFFTIKQFTGNGSNQTLSHDLGCEPSMIWVKNVEDDGHSWGVYHKQLDATNPEAYQLFLDTADDRIASNDMWNNTKPTNSEFTVGNNAHSNASGKKYIAYLFGADQAAFGRSGTDVIAKTGTYDGNSGGPNVVTLGFEPQMVMIKNISSGTPRNWIVIDKIRGMTIDKSSVGIDAFQYQNLTGSADFTNSFIDFTPEGFTLTGSSNNNNVTGQTYVYYAIRNEMTRPISGTDVYATSVGNATNPSFYSGFPVDAVWRKNTASSGDWNVGFRKSGRYDMKWNDKNTNEGSYSSFEFHNSTAWGYGNDNSSYQSWMFKRARGFFDLQYWDGDSTTPRQLPHQLGVTPEMMIVKSRNNISDGWYVYHKDIPSLSYLKVHSSDKEYSGADCWTSNAPTDTHFYLGVDTAVNGNASYHGQLFATLPGVSKVGSYEINANGDSVTVDCGFSAGPRFLLIKDYTNDSTDWMLFDTLRGLATANASFGNAEWITPGNYNWTCPVGVTSVSAVAVGGAGFYMGYNNGGSGGGGAGLGWRNNITVVPGQTYSVRVGDHSDGGSSGWEHGQDSYFIGAGTSVTGGGGRGAGVNVGGNGGSFDGDGGGNGGKGAAGASSPRKYGGGGGAGGYSGDGGVGGFDRLDNDGWNDYAGTNGTGGAGAGSYAGAQGGGVGIYGEGASGVSANAQEGGSGGYGSNAPEQLEGRFGGGRGSNTPSLDWGGAVRIVWSVDGSPVAFPSTNVQHHETGLDASLKLNTQGTSVKDTDYFDKTSSGFMLKTNTVLTTPNAKYIFLAIA